MCEGYEGKQKDDKVKKQGDYCSQNRDSKRKGKLIRDEVTELGSRLPGEISITSDMQMTPPLWQKVKKN